MAGLELISQQATSALDGAAIPASTKEDIKAKYAAAAKAAEVQRVEARARRTADWLIG